MIQIVLSTLLLFGLAIPLHAEVIKPKKAGPSLNIHGFRIGMTTIDVKKLLRKKNVKDYKTGFSDLFMYHPSPDVEVRLVFTCSPRGHILRTVELSTAYTAEETDAAIPKFKEKLVSKYGMPVIRESQWNMLDFCWGQCGQEPQGTKLEAKTTPLQGNMRSLALVLSNEGLAKKCENIRHRKINQWLYRWIAHVQKFKPGMSLKEASVLYRRRYQDRLMPDEERDETVQQHAVMHYVVNDLDFFAGLDYESLNFEGQEPGTIVLKFTGEQAGRNSRLNKRLYYASFSTTAFTDSHSYQDVQQKLDRFIKIHGKPVQFTRLNDGITALWQQGAEKIFVSIFDSGLIRFEQSDPSIQEAYRDAAVKKIEEFNKTRFDKAVF